MENWYGAVHEVAKSWAWLSDGTASTLYQKGETRLLKKSIINMNEIYYECWRLGKIYMGHGEWECIYKNKSSKNWLMVYLWKYIYMEIEDYLGI